MKKILTVAVLVVFAACNSNSDNAKVDSMKSGSDSTKMDDMNYPYTADYSSKFEIGSSKNAMTVLQLYKDWDNNTLDNSKNSFAEMNDTLVFASGDILTGSRDSIMAASQKIRGTMGTVQDIVHAWIPLKSTDKNEEWVAVWTREIRTDAKGKKDSSELMETWRFDKDGKANLLYQYEEKPVKMPPPPPPKK